MKWRIITGLVGFLIIGVPMILLNLGALGRQAQVERALSGNTSVPGVIADAGTAVDGLYGDVREGQWIKALFDPEGYFNLRHVAFTETLSVDDVLGEGEIAPEEDLHRLYVVARAPGRAMAYCDVMLETLATGCAIGSTEVDPRDDGTFNVTSRMSYRPAYDMGSTEVDGARDLYTVRVDLPRPRSDRRLARDQVGARKTEVIEATLAACDTLREERGNCVIERIDFREASVDGRSDLVAFSASASLRWVGPRAEGADNTLVGQVIHEGSSGPEESEARQGFFQRFSAIFKRESGSGDRFVPIILRGEHERHMGGRGLTIKVEGR